MKKVDSEKVEEVLKVFSDTLKHLGVEDFILSTLSETEDGKEQYHTVFEAIDEVTIAHIMMVLEKVAPESVQNYIAKHELAGWNAESVSRWNDEI